ncbi:GDP-D-glucose phosphorylase 1 [Pieris rapae]|uniref:GDP-D-glucose phosphorylase 1 n=1 Tax=Pieris rapae TaxID=64459 RepID=UPI001E2807BB|nr:GDP-D-glucose phosphorylase 1 [Pieris rapae]
MYEFQGKDDSFRVDNLNFIQKLKERWHELHVNTSIFRYKLGTLKEKLAGNYVLKLNHDRSVKRRQPEHMTDICQPFDENKFNFSKVSSEEVLYKFWNKDATNIHAIVVNVSPINYYHSLLCPSIYQMLPQVVTLDSLKLVLYIHSLSQDCDLRIAYNSLCALASVNHLHYHLLFEKQKLPIEYANCIHIKGPLWLMENYPIPGFCFDGNAKNAAEDIFKLIQYFLANSIAHNIFITKGCCFNNGDDVTRVFVFARKSTAGAKQLSAFNVAALELGGYFAVYSDEDFEKLEVHDLDRELAKWKLDNFDQLCKEVEKLFL